MQDSTLNAPGGAGNAAMGPVIKELHDAPDAFALLFAPESEETLHHRPADGEWSAVEIVAHIADLDAFNRTERFNAMLIEENPALPAYEPDARVMEANYQALTGTDALELMKRERDLITVLLEGLRPHELARTGVHPRYGERTLQQMADMRNHDRTHLDQVVAAIAAAK